MGAQHALMFMCKLTTVAALLGLAVVGAGVASSSVTGAAVVAVGAVVTLVAVVAVGAVVATSEGLATVTGDGLATVTGDGLATTGAAAGGRRGAAGTEHALRTHAEVRSPQVQGSLGGSENSGLLCQQVQESIVQQMRMLVSWVCCFMPSICALHRRGMACVTLAAVQVDRAAPFAAAAQVQSKALLTCSVSKQLPPCSSAWATVTSQPTICTRVHMSARF